MKVKEAIEIINNAPRCYSLRDAEELIKECEFIERIKYDSHRWYIMATDIYRVEDGYVGIRGVSELKSEMMNFSDCDIHCTAKEYKAVNTISYIPAN